MYGAGFGLPLWGAPKQASTNFRITSPNPLTIPNHQF